MGIETTILSLASDWCINLSAAYFGAAFIVPVFQTPSGRADLADAVVRDNILYAVALFGLAAILKNI